jgi:hypothetical protein
VFATALSALVIGPTLLFSNVPAGWHSLENKSLGREALVGSLDHVSDANNNAFSFRVFPQHEGKFSSAESAMRRCVVNASHYDVFNIFFTQPIWVRSEPATRPCLTVRGYHNDLTICQFLLWKQASANPDVTARDELSVSFTDFVLIIFKTIAIARSVEVPNHSYCGNIPMVLECNLDEEKRLSILISLKLARRDDVNRYPWTMLGYEEFSAQPVRFDGGKRGVSGNNECSFYISGLRGESPPSDDPKTKCREGQYDGGHIEPKRIVRDPFVSLYPTVLGALLALLFLSLIGVIPHETEREKRDRRKNNAAKKNITPNAPKPD